MSDIATISLPASVILGPIVGDGTPPPGVRYEGEPTVTTHFVHAAEGQPAVLVWASTPGTVVYEHTDAAEIGFVVSGRLRVVGDDGTSVEVGPGDAFVNPKGWTGRVEVLEDVRKVIVVG